LFAGSRVESGQITINTQLGTDIKKPTKKVGFYNYF